MVPTDGLASRFLIEREIGRGGMATVHLATDQRHGSRAAVKILHPELGPLLGAARFAREITITARLQHPGILPVLDSGESDGLLWYAMPYVEGGTLADRIARQGQLPIGEALDITCEVADALAYAHAQGVVHRDIKPSNILLPGGRAVLADFGIAHLAEAPGQEKLTSTGVALGTVQYMSPEQAAGERVDARSDVYSLGCVLYEMLAGDPPFTGTNARTVIARHATSPVPPLRPVRPTVSEALEQVVLTALAKVPADRYADAGVFRDALRRCAHDTGPLPTTRPTPVRRGRGRGRAVRLAAAGAAVAVAGVAAWRLWPGAAEPLDPNRVLVYPLVAPADPAVPRTIGEDVATMIGSALDGAGQLRWIDAWPLLDSAGRSDVRAVSNEDRRALARQQRAAYTLIGRVVTHGDSADVILELRHVVGDSVVASSRASGPGADAWRLGLRAANALLPTLIPGGRAGLAADWQDRDPAAVASFLRAEAAFRRVHLPEALTLYRAAVAADSAFALAAIRGAQAAVWNHRSDEASTLIRTALANPLPPRHARFARGVAAYLEGRADSAAAELGAALRMDPDMAVAWMQLGEVYTHLLPRGASADSAAEAAFARAHALDPAAALSLLHLVELRLRRGDVAGAEAPLRQFLAAKPDSTLAAQLRLMDRCVRRGPDGVDWQAEVAANAGAVAVAAKQLLAGGGHPGCARAGFAAVLRHDAPVSPAAEGRRWVALLGTVGARLHRGDAAAVAAEIDSSMARDEGGASFFLFLTALAPELRPRAAAMAADELRRYGPDFAGAEYAPRILQLAQWAGQERRLDVATAARQALEARAARRGAPGDRLLADAAAAHLALARGDTADAVRRLAALAPVAPPGPDLEWDLVSPLGYERLLHARLLLATGRAREALAAASALDASMPMAYSFYLPASLALRAAAAEALGRGAQAAELRRRLARMRAGEPAATR